MFHRNRKPHSYPGGFSLETLENRQLLSASGFGFGRTVSSVEFDQAPPAVQTGLENLATTDGLTAPTSTSTQSVRLNNVNGTETYTINISGTPVTVDQNGNAITAPTHSTTTWDTLSGTGTGSNAAASAEISAIATALNLTAPVSTTTVFVTTASDGTSTYTIFLNNSSGWGGRSITVDSNGNPTGNENIPFSAAPAAIQNGLNSNAPAGATAISDTSLQNVRVRVVDGVTLYSVTFMVSGTRNIVTVDATGALASYPTTTTTEFDDIPTAAQTELQTWATNEGVTGTISTTQSVSAYTEPNGTVIYSVNLVATVTTSSGNTYNHKIVLSVDEDGNPTTLPNQLFGGSFFDVFAGFNFGGYFSGYGYGFWM